MQSTNVAYTIDDSTGVIEVRLWQNDSDDDSEQVRMLRSALVEGVYVHVYGKVQEYNSVKNITGFSIRPLTDHNEIASHLAHAALTHLQNVRGVAAHQQPRGAGVDAPVVGFQRSATNGLTPLQNAIMDVFVQSVSGDNGLSIQEVQRMLPGSYSYQQVQKDIAWMSNEGHLYSTCDDDHYRPTGQ